MKLKMVMNYLLKFVFMFVNIKTIWIEVRERAFRWVLFSTSLDGYYKITDGVLYFVSVMSHLTQLLTRYGRSLSKLPSRRQVPYNQYEIERHCSNRTATSNNKKKTRSIYLSKQKDFLDHYLIVGSESTWSGPRCWPS